MDGVWIGFIDHLYTPLGTTSNYSATANLHTLQITAARAKSSLSSVDVSWQRLLTTEIPGSHCNCPANIPQLNSYRLSTHI
jgi:hypothetical protein